MDAREHQGGRWELAEPRPAREIHLEEVTVKIALGSCPHYSVVIHS